MVKHLKHQQFVSVGRTKNVMACTGEKPFNSQHHLTVKINNVTCRECFYLWHHPKVKCCGGKGKKS